MQALRGIASVAAHLFHGLSQASIQELVAEMQRQAAEEQAIAAAARFGTDEMMSPTSGGILPGEWEPQRRAGFRFVINDEFGRPVVLHFNNLPRGLAGNERVNFDPDTGNVGNTAVDQVVNTLFEQYQPSGPPPTDSRTLHNLLRHEVTVDAAIKERAQSCSVCMADYEVDEKVIRLPCDHFYHRECIEKWLEEHNTCPVCRKEFKPAGEAAQNTQPNRPAEQQRQRLAQSRSPAPQRAQGRQSSDVDNAELQRAIAASLAETQAPRLSPRPTFVQQSPITASEDAELQRALAASRREWENEQRQRQRQREQQREGRQLNLAEQMPGMGGRAISPDPTPAPRNQNETIERDGSWVFVNQNGQNNNNAPRIPTAPPLPQQRPISSAPPAGVGVAHGAASSNHPQHSGDTPEALRRLAAQAAERRARDNAAQERGLARQHLMLLPESELEALMRAQGQEVKRGMKKEEFVEKLLPPE